MHVRTSCAFLGQKALALAIISPGDKLDNLLSFCSPNKGCMTSRARAHFASTSCSQLLCLLSGEEFDALGAFVFLCFVPGPVSCVASLSAVDFSAAR